MAIWREFHVQGFEKTSAGGRPNEGSTHGPWDSAWASRLSPAGKASNKKTGPSPRLSFRSSRPPTTPRDSKLIQEA